MHRYRHKFRHPWTRILNVALIIILHWLLYCQGQFGSELKLSYRPAACCSCMQANRCARADPISISKTRVEIPVAGTSLTTVLFQWPSAQGRKCQGIRNTKTAAAPTRPRAQRSPLRW
jgi:hypothetical protein